MSARRLRVGVINLMPRAETYEPSVVAALSAGEVPVEPVWIRLASHGYKSSDAAHLAARYRRFDRALDEGPLDGIVLTGAPVEALPFASVRYWAELSEILRYARRSVTSTLGLCWGGMCLAALEGIPKIPLSRKLFGAFRHTLTEEGERFLPGLDGGFWCAQSRHAGIADEALERAAAERRVTLYGHAPEAGYSLFATPDRRFVMHLGHPEYEPARIAFEWSRDRALGRTDVPPPRNFDPEGRRPVAPWEADSRALFRAWLREVVRGRAREDVLARVAEAR